MFEFPVLPFLPVPLSLPPGLFIHYFSLFLQFFSFQSFICSYSALLFFYFKHFVLSGFFFLHFHFSDNNVLVFLFLIQLLSITRIFFLPLFFLYLLPSIVFLYRPLPSFTYLHFPYKAVTISFTIPLFCCPFHFVPSLSSFPSFEVCFFLPSFPSCSSSFPVLLPYFS